MSYKKDLERHRASKDQFMKSHQSPLDDPNLKNKFSHLDYFQIDERWKFELKLQKYDEVLDVQMETSAGGIQDYKRIGYLEFTQPDSGEEVKINVYQGQGGHYFVPFRDKTSGETSYGAGRYLDVKADGDTFVLDFNLGYNPFCAYSYNYTCPLPPFENWLQIEVTAGEKDFPLGH